MKTEINKLHGTLAMDHQCIYTTVVSSMIYIYIILYILYCGTGR